MEGPADFTPTKKPVPKATMMMMEINLALDFLIARKMSDNKALLNVIPPLPFDHINGKRRFVDFDSVDTAVFHGDDSPILN